MPDNIDHPIHYNKGKIECIDYIIDQDLGFFEGNIVKYITRWESKGGIDDLKKAQWYLDKLIELHESIAVLFDDGGVPKDDTGETTVEVSSKKKKKSRYPPDTSST